MTCSWKTGGSSLPFPPYLVDSQNRQNFSSLTGHTLDRLCCLMTTLDTPAPSPPGSHCILTKLSSPRGRTHFCISRKGQAWKRWRTNLQDLTPRGSLARASLICLGKGVGRHAFSIRGVVSGGQGRQAGMHACLSSLLRTSNFFFLQERLGCSAWILKASLWSKSFLAESFY